MVTRRESETSQGNRERGWGKERGKGRRSSSYTQDGTTDSAAQVHLGTRSDSPASATVVLITSMTMPGSSVDFQSCLEETQTTHCPGWQMIKVLANNPNDLSLRPRTHIVKTESQLLQVVHTCAHTPTKLINAIQKLLKIWEWGHGLGAEGLSSLKLGSVPL